MKWIVSYKEKLKHMKVKPKIILGFTAITVISYILSLSVIFSLTTQQMTETANEQVQMLNNQYAVNLENSYYELSYQIAQCLSEASLQEFINGAEYTTEYSKTEVIKKTCGKYDFVTKYVNYICVESGDGEIAFWKNITDSVDESVYLSHLQKAESWSLDNTDVMIFVQGGEVAANEVLVYVEIVDTSNLKTQGMAIFSIQSDYFIESLKWDENEKDYFIFVENEWDQLVIDVATHEIEDESDYWSDEISVPKLHWNIKLLLSKDDFQHQTMQLRYRLTLLTLVLIVAGYFFFGVLVDRMTTRLAELERNMSKVEQGDYSMRIASQNYDEIGLLAQRFNHMASSIDHLINQVYLQEIEKKQKEFEILQAQINPHFLYNSLGTIKWQAKLDGNQGMYDYVSSLITVLKLTAKTTSAFISVEHEMEYTEKYIIMQQYRMGNRFSVVYDIDKNCYSYTTLKFILQPIIENAIFHAFSEDVADPTITITLRAVAGDLEFTIADNGIGMSEERLKNIYTTEKAKHGMNSVGIMNVNERIKLYFGEPYGMEIESTLAVGTTIRLRIPAKEGELDGKENINR